MVDGGQKIEGRVISVEGPVVCVKFSSSSDLPPLYGIIKVKSAEGKEIALEVVEHLEENVARCISFSSTLNLRRDSIVIATDVEVKIPAGEELRGRIIDLLGRPLDGKGEIVSSETVLTRRLLEVKEEIKRRKERQILETGIKIIDLFFPLMKGAKLGILGGAALGKSILTLELIHNITGKQRGICIFSGVGERIREGNELYHEFLRHGILDKVIMIFAQMNEPPGARFEVVSSGISLAEYFQKKNKDVLFFMDNVYRFVQAGAEVSTLLGRIPSELGYQPTLVSEISSFHERIHSLSEQGSITAIETVYVPADDLTDPAVVTIFSYLDSIIVLSREKIQRGLYPAVDILRSSSSSLDLSFIGRRHFELTQEVLKIFVRYEELERIVSLIGIEELSSADRILYQRARKIENFLTQPFFTAELYTEKKAEYVKLEDTLAGVEKIISGEVDSRNEEDFYMIGKWEEK